MSCQEQIVMEGGVRGAASPRLADIPCAVIPPLPEEFVDTGADEIDPCERSHTSRPSKLCRPPDMLWTGVLGETRVDDRVLRHQSNDKLMLAILEFERGGRWLKIAEYLRSRLSRGRFPGEQERITQLEAVSALVSEKRGWERRRRKRLLKRGKVELVDWCDAKFAGAEYIAAESLLASADLMEQDVLRRLKEIAKLEHLARGLRAKANRQAACCLFAVRADGSICEQPQAYKRFCCKNRYCPTCAPRSFRELLKKYRGLEPFVSQMLAKNPRYQLRILDITAVKPRGGRMPTRREVIEFGEQVKELFRRIEEYCGLPCGYLYCMEFGFLNENLHCHGLLLSSFVPQKLLSEWWSEIRGDGSYRVVIGLAKSMREGETPFESALKHALEYTGKYATFGPSTPFSPRRALALELAFHGAKRVRALGLFFNRVNETDDDESGGEVPCPCGRAGCFLNRRDDLGWFLSRDLENRGLFDLDAEEAVSETGAGPP